MQHVLARLQELLEVGLVLIGVHLGGLSRRAVLHGLVELIEGHGLAQIVAVQLAVQLVVEADVGNVARFKVLLAQVGRGAAADDI